jgi:hypothetical protein
MNIACKANRQQTFPQNLKCQGYVFGGQRHEQSSVSKRLLTEQHFLLHNDRSKTLIM